MKKDINLKADEIQKFLSGQIEKFKSINKIIENRQKFIDTKENIQSFKKEIK